MQGEELNQQASSQPVAQAPGPNAVEKPSEPVARGNMTESQSSDYYNKTQQLAAERRALDEERKAFDSQRVGQPNVSQQSQTPWSNNGYPAHMNNQGQPYAQPHQGFQPQVPQTYIPPETAKALVAQFGYEGAESIVQLTQTLNQPYAQQLAHTQHILTETQKQGLEAQISAKGQEQYGPEWTQHKAPVMDLIKQYGMPLNVAWNAVRGDAIKQQAIDQAYQAQQQKEQGNVNTQNAQPSQGAQPAINSVGDAFQSAMRQHNG